MFCGSFYITLPQSSSSDTGHLPFVSVCIILLADWLCGFLDSFSFKRWLLLGKTNVRLLCPRLFLFTSHDGDGFIFIQLNILSTPEQLDGSIKILPTREPLPSKRLEQPSLNPRSTPLEQGTAKLLFSQTEYMYLKGLDHSTPGCPPPPPPRPNQTPT